MRELEVVNESELKEMIEQLEENQLLIVELEGGLADGK
ncbi:hypothetical protein M2145_001110 [Lachnospiraceae bacterium PF1-21]